MHAAEGILTSRGGMTSHAAVVARGMGKPCVAGAGEPAHRRARNGRFTVGETLKAGDTITIDGGTGEVLKGAVPTLQPDALRRFRQDHGMGRQVPALGCAPTPTRPADARGRATSAPRASACAAPSTCSSRATGSRDARDDPRRRREGRRRGAREAAALQRDDFIGIFEAMKGLPVTIRLLDPPLHEFLPKTEKEIAARWRRRSASRSRSSARVEQLHEIQPDARPPRLPPGDLLSRDPEMQARAITEAAVEAPRRAPVHPEIMIPLVGLREGARFRQGARSMPWPSRGHRRGHRRHRPIKVGTMIEMPRAAHHGRRDRGRWPSSSASAPTT
jgi:pyruvate,orthophosphate dikinase